MRRFISLLSIMCFLLSAFSAQGAPLERQWVTRYSSPGYERDGATGLAVDHLGNVYVTGGAGFGIYGSKPFTTIKYGPDGKQLWVAEYEYGFGAAGLALDNSGNVYVAGTCAGWVGEETDYATVKYDTDGNELWVAIYEDPGDPCGPEEAHALVVDSAGNVYVTGESTNDYATVKYDSDGNELWAARYDSLGYDYAYALAVDGLNNVYVTGWSDGGYATIKYDPNGDQLWVAHYNGPGDDEDIPSALAVDALGNVYVAGDSYGGSTFYDYATVKYDPNGDELWVARYNGPGDDYDGAFALAVDDTGNAYVTGVSDGGSMWRDYVTIKYDPNGDQVWIARYSSDGMRVDHAYALAVDNSGNVYVTGESDGDYATVKYDPNGNELWVDRYDGPGTDEDIASALAVDNSGNVYVTGGSDGDGTDYDYATIKYSPVVVGFGVFVKFAQQWPDVGPGLASDLDKDNDVDMADLRLLTELWLDYYPSEWMLK